MGLATLLSYQVFYLLNHLHENPSGVGTLVFLSTLVQTILIVIFSNLGGTLSDRFHRRKIFVIIAAVIYAAGFGFVYLRIAWCAVYSTHQRSPITA